MSYYNSQNFNSKVISPSYGYLTMRSRPAAMSDFAIISTGSVYSSIVGSRIIDSGGNVADAAIASSLVLSVVQNNLCGLGGDLFALIRMNGKVIDLNASGKSSRNISVDTYLERNLKRIPNYGEMAAINVPGYISGIDFIHRNYASMEISELVRPARDLAEKGFPVPHSYSDSIRAAAKHLGSYTNWRNIFLPAGKVPAPGSIFKQKDLANVLSALMKDGLGSFYNGYTADVILKGLEETEVPIDSQDLTNHKIMKSEALSVPYKDYKIYATRPNSQAITTLIWLNILGERNTGKEENLGTKELVESGLVAYEARRKVIGDPEVLSFSDYYIGKEYARSLIDRNIPAEGGTSGDEGDTTYFCVANTEGDALSVIQSNYMGFGSGIIPNGTGFVLQNRGCYFTLDVSHHNSLAPGKRTFHTIGALLGEKDGEFALELGCMGGDIQPQVHIQLLNSMLNRGKDPQTAIDNARWAFPGTIYEQPSTLILEEGLAENIMDLKIAGLTPLTRKGKSSEFGHAQAISMTDYGTLVGGADPRGDGICLPILRGSTSH